MSIFDVPPPELCLGCGDDLQFGLPMGTSDRHICPLRERPSGNPTPPAGGDS